MREAAPTPIPPELTPDEPLEEGAPLAHSGPPHEEDPNKDLDGLANVPYTEGATPEGDPFLHEVARRAAAGNRVARVALLGMMQEPQAQDGPNLPSSRTKSPVGRDSTDTDTSLRGLDSRSASFIRSADRIFEMGLEPRSLKELMKWDGTREGLDELIEELGETARKFKNRHTQTPSENDLLSERRLRITIEQLKSKSEQLKLLSDEQQGDMRGVAQRAYQLTKESNLEDEEPILTDSEINEIVAQEQKNKRGRRSRTRQEHKKKLITTTRAVARNTAKRINKAASTTARYATKGLDRTLKARDKYVESVKAAYHEGLTSDETDYGFVQRGVVRAARASGRRIGQRKLEHKQGRGRVRPRPSTQARQSNGTIVRTSRNQVPRPARTEWGKRYQAQQAINRRGVV